MPRSKFYCASALPRIRVCFIAGFLCSRSLKKVLDYGEGWFIVADTKVRTGDKRTGTRVIAPIFAIRTANRGFRDQRQPSSGEATNHSVR
jgi:hypothetical protein